MALWKVEMEKTVYMTHVIEAETEQEAIDKMQSPLHEGLVNILEDDSEVEYNAYPYEEGE